MLESVADSNRGKSEYRRIVKVLLRLKGWNVERMATELDVTPQAVYGWLKGITPRIAERDKLRSLLLEWGERYADWFELEGPGTADK